jgi:hypothetical protein
MIDWILEHWVDLLAIYGAVVAICSTIVKITPTTKDDNVWAKILKILDKFSVCFTKEDIEKLANATKKSKK